MCHPDRNETKSSRLLHDWDLNAYGGMTLEMFISMMCITNIYVISRDWTMYPWLILQGNEAVTEFNKCIYVSLGGWNMSRMCMSM